MAEERTELEKWLKELLRAAAQINEFYQEHLLREGEEESLRILGGQETRAFRAIMQPGREGRLGFALDVPEGQALLYLIKDPGWNAYIAFNVSGRGQVIQRVYFDDGNVPFQEIKNIIFSFESRFKQRRPGGARESVDYNEAKARYDAGEDAAVLRKEYIDKTESLVLEQCHIEHPDSDEKKWVRNLARDRVYHAFARRRIGRLK